MLSFNISIYKLLVLFFPTYIKFNYNFTRTRGRTLFLAFKYFYINRYHFSLLIATSESGITQKWHKLRRRCASFKAMSSTTGPSSLDSDESATFILTDDDDHHRRRSSHLAAAATILPRANPNNVIRRHHPPQSQHFWRTSSTTPDKYDYRNVNLSGSVSEKMGKRILSADEYSWRNTTSIDRSNGKEWQRSRRSIHQPAPPPPPPPHKDLADWEFSVQQYENLMDRSGGGGGSVRRLQYYDDQPDVPTDRKIICPPEKKETLRFPGLKTFKSASMRLPGQKSSIQEVQQLLRLKFNRINIGLRKRRALSVQEVFHQQQNDEVSVPPPPQFYVPSPLADGKRQTNNNNNNYNDDGPSSLPYFVNDSMKMQETKEQNSSRSTQLNGLKRLSHSGGSSSNNTNGDLVRNRSVETTQLTTPKIIITPSSSSSTSSPQFQVGGCVTTTHTSRDVCSSLEQKIRLRPRSHSPLKSVDDKLKSRKKRESFGFFERINRMMHTGSTTTLPPPHSGSNAKINQNNNTAVHLNKNARNEVAPTAPNNTNNEISRRLSGNNKNFKNLTLASMMTSSTDDGRMAKPDIVRDRKPSKQQVNNSFN